MNPFLSPIVYANADQGCYVWNNGVVEHHLPISNEMTNSLNLQQVPIQIASDYNLEEEEIHKDIDEKIKNSSSKPWHFEWLYKLREWKLVHEAENPDRQVHLRPNRSSDVINNLRAKLGDLQTEMVGFQLYFFFLFCRILILFAQPAWNLLNQIKEAAVALAFIKERSLFEKVLEQGLDLKQETEILTKRFSQDETDSEETVKKYCDACKDFFKDPNCPRRTRKPCKEKVNKAKKFLKHFVRDRVKCMLSTLYTSLWEVERAINQVPNTSPKSQQQAEGWYRHIYGSPKTGIGPLFGPVGERPLHVCFLSAYRFADVDFLKARTSPPARFTRTISVCFLWLRPASCVLGARARPSTAQRSGSPAHWLLLRLERAGGQLRPRRHPGRHQKLH